MWIAAMLTMSKKFFFTDLNFAEYDEPYGRIVPSGPMDWIDLDVDEYIDYNKNVIGSNIMVIV